MKNSIIKKYISNSNTMNQFRFYSLLFITLLITINFTKAQSPVFDSSDFAFAGKKLKYIQSSSNSISYNVTGANAMWNYANLSSNKAYTDTFTSVFTSPINYAFFFALNSNMARPENNPTNLIGNLQQNLWMYYKKTATKFQISGNASEISGVPVPTLYSSPEVLYKYPLAFGQVDSSTSHYNISAASLVGTTINEMRHRVNTVDGWGTLITPTDTLPNTIRIHSIIKVTDSVTLNGSGMNITSGTFHEYKFISKNMDWPVLQINTSELFGFEFVTSVFYRDTIRKKNTSVGTNLITDFNVNNKLKIYPNPVKDRIYLELDESLKNDAKTVYFYDVLGRKISSFNLEGNYGSFYLNSLPKGVYFMKIEAIDYSIVNKFVVE